MRAITTSTDKLTCFDEQVWLAERQIINFEHNGPEATSVSVYTPVWGTAQTPIATFKLNSEHKVTIDVTDLIRMLHTYSNNTQIQLICDHGSASTINVPYTIMGLTNPKDSATKPDHGIDYAYCNVVIAPPRMIYRNDDFDPLVEVMVDKTRSSGNTVCKLGNDTITWGTPQAIEVLGDCLLTQTSTDVSALARTIAKYKLREMLCGHRYAIVRWVSATGVTKAFTWELLEPQAATGDTIALETVDGTYNTIKGKTESFVLYLDNLSAYDYWYYSDIATSSKVEVSIDGGNEFFQVEVGTKSVTIPDGNAGKMNELKIDVTYRNYDAVTM